MIAIDRFRNMILLGISHLPLKLGDVQAEELWSIDYDFHISCIWRLRKKNVIISGYQDVYTEIDDDGNVMEESVQEEESVRKRTLFEKNIFGKVYPDLPLKILKIYQSEMGDLRIEMEKGYCFEAFTTCTAEEDMEEWYLKDIGNDKEYFWPERDITKILLIDEDNTELSQLLEMILNEIITDDDMTVFSAGMNPGMQLSDRVLKAGREWYGVDAGTILKTGGVCDMEAYHCVVPIGISIPEDEFPEVEQLRMYENYTGTGKETPGELYDMAIKICKALGVAYSIDEKQREIRKKEIRKYEKVLKSMSAFYGREGEKPGHCCKEISTVPDAEYIERNS